MNTKTKKRKPRKTSRRGHARAVGSDGTTIEWWFNSQGTRWRARHDNGYVQGGGHGLDTERGMRESVADLLRGLQHAVKHNRFRRMEGP